MCLVPKHIWNAACVCLRVYGFCFRLTPQDQDLLKRVLVWYDKDAHSTWNRDASVKYGIDNASEHYASAHDVFLSKVCVSISFNRGAHKLILVPAHGASSFHFSSFLPSSTSHIVRIMGCEFGGDYLPILICSSFDFCLCCFLSCLLAATYISFVSAYCCHRRTENTRVLYYMLLP